MQLSMTLRALQPQLHPSWREADADPELFVARTQKKSKRRIHLNSLFVYRQEPGERTNVFSGSPSYRAVAVALDVQVYGGC